MSVPPESIEVGRCYLATHRKSAEVWQVVSILPDGSLQYRSRPADPGRGQVWRSSITTISLLAGTVTREVPCGWTPEVGANKTRG